MKLEEQIRLVRVLTTSNNIYLHFSRNPDFPPILPSPCLAALRCVGSKVAAIQREKVRCGWARVVCWSWCGHSLCASNLYSANIGLFFASKCLGIKTRFSLLLTDMRRRPPLSAIIRQHLHGLVQGEDTCADVMFRHIVTLSQHDMNSSRVSAVSHLVSLCVEREFSNAVNLRYVASGYQMGFSIAQSHIIQYSLFLCLLFQLHSRRWFIIVTLWSQLCI